MEQREMEARARRIRQRKRRRRQLRLFLHLFSISIFLSAAAVLMAVFLPDKGNQMDLPAVDIPVSVEPIQSILTQSAPEPAPVLNIAADSWKLLLVNPWNSLPEDYSIETVTLRNDLQVDERCCPDLQAMMDDCRADGLSPIICSAYRTREVQERLYQAKVEWYLAEGYARDNAKAAAGKVVAVPGTSEHQLGLAVDIVDVNHQLLDESQEHTEVQKWLMEHSWEYGFILRYPAGKSEITGIVYEPWHYRYVGREHAEQIHALGVCLEEYLEGTHAGL